MATARAMSELEILKTQVAEALERESSLRRELRYKDEALQHAVGRNRRLQKQLGRRVRCTKCS